jgi:DNA-binding PadR family transcriptional regulator
MDWMRSPSVWKGPVLAVLADGPGHPYDVSTRVWQRLGPEWRQPAKDIYRVLKEAESLGLASSTEQASTTRGGKPLRVYAATDKTPAAVEFWMGQPLPPEPDVRSSLTARMILSREQHIPLMRRALDEQEQLLVDCSREHDKPFPTDTYSGLEKELARKAVVLQMTAWMDWVEFARAALEDFEKKRRA